MSQVVIGDILPYTQATAIQNQTVFGTNWTANYASDVVVYVTPLGDTANDVTQILSYPAAYTVAFIGAQQQVQVTLVTPVNSGDIVTITRQTPAARTNLYSNTNFTPSMLNNDFGILTLVDQQAQLVDQKVAPRYNYSSTIVDVVDTILPVLGADEFWAKNSTNTGFIAIDINTVLGGVTQIDTGLGLTGGPITSTGTISFAAMPANTFWANINGFPQLPAQVPTTYFLQSANNLSDLTNVPQAQINIGLEIGVNVQAYSPSLTSLASVSTSANQIPYLTASNTWSVMAAQANNVLTTNAGSVPALRPTLPTLVQSNITQLGTQTQALNMGSNLINNVTNPVSAQDAATKNYVDTAAGAYLPLAGGTMSGIINMGSHKITNLTDPTSAQDAASKAYADLMLPLAGGTMSGIINMNSHKVTNVTDPSAAQDAATKNYVDTATTGFLPLSGGTMSGAINMNNHKVTNLTDPSSAQDAVSLNYLNTSLASYLALSGGTMTGAINMGSHKITSVTDPTNPQDAATKNYVDTVAAGLTVKAACYAATTANLNATYANGASGIGATLTNAGALAAFTTDGTTPASTSRILVWEQTSSLQNGIYTVTTAGSGAVAWVLTRATDYDQPSEIKAGDLVIINNGTLYSGTSFVQTATVTAIGTDPILFSQFTSSASAVLLKANNLSDVASTTTSFNNISPLTTKGDLIAYNSGNVRLAVGSTDGQIMQVSSGAATGLAWSTATYPVTTSANRILYSSATNVVGQITSLAGGVLVTDSSSVPQMLTNPTAANRLLLSGNAAIPAWSTSTHPTSSSTAGKMVVSDGTNWVMSTPTFPNASATSGKIIISDGTNWIASTPTFPNSASGTGTLLRADGTNWVATTTTYPNTNAINTLLYASSANVMSALATANNGLLVTGPTTGTPSILAGPGSTGNLLQSNAAAAPSFSTATHPSTSGAAGKVVISDGTNWIMSTPTYPNTSAAVNKIMISDGTNWIASTPTFPVSASATSRKIIVSDGTNWVASTETYAVPGTSGNVMTSDGTNWVSSPVSASGTVNSGTQNQLAWYAANGTAVSGLATANSGLLATSAGGVPSIQTSNVVTNALAAQMPSNTIKGNNTGGTAAPSDLTVTQAQALLQIGSAVSKNLIYGGNFDTNPWQRGTSFAAVASGTYTADRFEYFFSGTGVVTISQFADAPTESQAGIYSTNCFKTAVTTADAAIAAGDFYIHQYVMEGYDFAQIAQRSFTLSFWHKHTVTGTYCVGFRNSGNDRCYVAEYTQTTTNTWEQATITVSASPSAGSWNYTTGSGIQILFTLAAGSTYQGTVNTWNTSNVFATANQVNGMSANTNVSEFALIQCEPGSNATPYAIRPVADELALCQRYYMRRTSIGTNSIFLHCGAYSTTVSFAPDQFPVQMRVPPSFTWDGTLANWYIAVNSTSIALTGAGLTSPNTTVGNTGLIQVAHNAFSAGFTAWLASNNASAWIAWNAEIV